MVTCFGQTLREIAQPTGSHLGTTRVVDAIEGYGGLVFGGLVWVALSVRGEGVEQCAHAACDIFAYLSEFVGGGRAGSPTAQSS